MTRTTSICYLCGEEITNGSSADHVPPKQFYAPDIRQKHNTSKLLTITVHQTCNRSYEEDEKYFLHSLAPFAHDSYTGNAVLRKIGREFREGKNQPLVLKVYGEFDPEPSGIVLLPGRMVKRFEGNRIDRVAWKIIRGLYFHHFNQVLTENTRHQLKLYLVSELSPGELPSIVPNTPPRGLYPAVFDYIFDYLPDPDNFHYWALLLWERIILIVQFKYP